MGWAKKIANRGIRPRPHPLKSRQPPDSFLDYVRLATQDPRQDMLSPEHKNEATPDERLSEKRQRLHLRDLTPRRDANGGGTPKSSPVPLPIPPKGFIVSNDN